MPYLHDMINDHKAPMKLKVNSSNKTQFGKWKYQLVMQVNFISSKDTGQTRIMYIWSHNAEIMMSSETDDIINELFRSISQNYQEGIQSINGSKFVSNSVDLLHYHLHKTSLKRGKSYIESLEWLKYKRATINQKNDDDNCFQYALTVTLNHHKIKKIRKEYQKLNHLLINITGKVSIFQQL